MREDNIDGRDDVEGGQYRGRDDAGGGHCRREG